MPSLTPSWTGPPTGHRERAMAHPTLSDIAEEYDFLDEPSQDVISEMQKEFSVFDFSDIIKERPLLSTNKNFIFYSFTGSKINRTLKLIFDTLGIQNIFSDLDSSFEIKTSQEEFMLKLKNIECSIYTLK